MRASPRRIVVAVAGSGTFQISRQLAGLRGSNGSVNLGEPALPVDGFTRDLFHS
jgi:hypothetical protein